MKMTDIKEIIGEDYVHSANSLFHFMSDIKYLVSAIQRKALCPRYCNEDVTYLNIKYNDVNFDKVAVLQKCFCDIPLRNIVRKFPIHLTENNDINAKERLLPEYSHTDLYGCYAIAFSKKWGEEHKLQPVHYLSEESENVSQFAQMLHDSLEQEELPDTISDALINWMCFLKPLRGTMWHRLETKTGDKIECEFYKNFHDEHEWRFVPFSINVDGNDLDCLIANGAVGSGFLQGMSDKLENERFKASWLQFQYDDIRYVIVPDNAGRRQVIETVQNTPDEMFDDEIQRSTLISKILVLDDIMKDF